MTDRSLKAHVRNPVLALRSAEKLQQLPEESRLLLAEILKELASDARGRAQQSWRRNKGPMAVYWKAVGAYSSHLSRAVRGGIKQ
jgi:hypothetical protein